MPDRQNKDGVYVERMMSDRVINEPARGELFMGTCYASAACWKEQYPGTVPSWLAQGQNILIWRSHEGVPASVGAGYSSVLSGEALSTW